LGNNDWYMFTGIFLTYKITNYLNECPTYPEKVYRLKSDSKRNRSDEWFNIQKGHPMFKAKGKKSESSKKNPGADKGPTPRGHRKSKKQ